MIVSSTQQDSQEMKSEAIFVFSTNSYFVPCLAVLLRSILDHADQNRAYRFVVLHSELDTKSMHTLETITGKEKSPAICVKGTAIPANSPALETGKVMKTQEQQNIRLEFIDVTKEIESYRFFTANRDNITQEAYFRLLIPWLLPEADKAVYLDCDMVALTDPSALYDTDVEAVLIAAARDLVGIGIYYSGRFGRRDYFDNVLCFPKPDDYFISGVMVMNLKRFREEFTQKQLLDYAVSRQWAFHDQDVLNNLCRSSKKLLSARWGALGRSEYDNFLPPQLRLEAKDAAENPYIFHFAGPKDKPWQRTTTYSLAWFWPAAARTPCYGELMERFIASKSPSQVVLRGEKNMFKRFLKKFLPMSARQSNFEYRCLEYQMAEQRMLTLQLLMQVQRMEAKGDPNISPAQLARRQELMAATAGNPACIRRVTPHTRLRFEVDVVGHCNMACAGCAHFAPLCKEEFTDIKEMERDFIRLSELFSGEVEYIHLIGGEPLLHPQIAEFAKLARKHFPVGRIEIVTNGILLPKMGEQFWQACHDSNITISVTRYPTKFAYDELPALAGLHNVRFQFFNHSGDQTVTFNKLPVDPLGSHNPDISFLNCYLANECIYLSQGRLYPCSLISHIRYFNEYFQRDIPVSKEDSIDIYTAQTGQEILNFLALPVPFCAYCDVAGRKHSLPWRASKREISEWT